MKHFKALGILAFVCLLLLWVPRLITGPKEEAKPETAARFPLLCVLEKGTEAQQQTAENADSGRTVGAEKAFSTADSRLRILPPRGMHDNNGHVIRGTYLFSAYLSVRLSERSG